MHTDTDLDSQHRPRAMTGRSAGRVHGSFGLAGLAGLVVLVACMWGARPAAAFEPFVGTRALGMGGGLRAAATGGSGPLLNPSGMSLTQSYNIEADYVFAHARDDNFFHASVVDSTSAFRLAGGFYYTYHSDDPDGPPSGHGHEAGLALALPFGDRVTIGGTLKYFLLSGDQQTVDLKTSGLTFDAGATVRVTSGLSLGVVGTNLRKLQTGLAPLAIGYGIALSPEEDVLLVVDGVTFLAADPPLPRKSTRISGGAEVLLAKKIALRAGGGYDGVSQNGFFTAGFSAVSEAGALDFGARQDAFQSGSAPRETILGVSFRLFVPQP
jgi:hypothetical protein